jgi:uncharacterized lipoprotein YehR (DUF1307 family)
MKKSVFSLTLLSLVLIAVMMMVVGCGDDDDEDPLPLNVTGTWTIVPIGYGTMTATLTHTGTTITGAVADATDYAQTIAGTTTASVGALSPRDIALTITFSDGMVLTLTGTVSDDNNSMSGMYNDSQGDSDSWSATRQ